MPSTFTACSLIRQVASSFGHIRQFRAYMETELERGDRKTQTRSALQSSGVTIADTPHNGGKEVADKQLIVDLFTFALDHPRATFVLITGDKDFAYACSTLRNRQYRMILVCPETGVSESLRQSCDQVVYWRTGVLGLPMRSVGVGPSTTKRPKSNHQQQHQDQPHCVNYNYARPAPAPPRSALPASEASTRSGQPYRPLASTSTTATDPSFAKPKQWSVSEGKALQSIKKREKKLARHAERAASSIQAREDKGEDRGKGEKRKIEVIELGSSSDEDDEEGKEDEDDEGFILPPSAKSARLPSCLPTNLQAESNPSSPTKRAPMANDSLHFSHSSGPASTSKSKGKVARLGQQQQSEVPSSDLIIVPSSTRKSRPSSSSTTAADRGPGKRRRSSLRSSTGAGSSRQVTSESSDAEDEVIISQPFSSLVDEPSFKAAARQGAARVALLQSRAAAAEEAGSEDGDGDEEGECEDEVGDVLVSRAGRR